MLSEKVKTVPELSVIVKKLKKEGKKIVLCHGVFDLIHPGHIRYFQSAKEHGDILIVAIPADSFVRKGPGLPIFHHDLRAEVLNAIHFVDFITIVESDNPADAIKKIQPHVFVKGPDTKQKKRFERGIKDIDETVAEAVKAVGAKVVYTEGIAYSSTGLINQYLDVYPASTKEFIGEFKQKYSDEDIVEKLLALKKMNILVVGDTIIDQYCYSVPLGKSSKEPITVHKFLSEESFAGGALATANHATSLSDNVTLVTLLGTKKNYESFIRRHMKPQVKIKIFYQPNGQTVIKRRYIDEFTKQKLFQVTYLKDDVKLEKVEKTIVSYLKNEVPKFDLVIANDFGHGFLTKKIIRVLCSKSKYLAINVQANSANYGFNVITKYPRADYVCIDEMELRLATHNKYGEIFSLMKRIFTKLHCRVIMATRGPYGAMIYSKGNGLTHVPALTQKVVDRVGAGDALFAISAPCVNAGMEDDIVAFVGNVAGALQVATIGNKTPIDFGEMVKFIVRLLK